MKEHAMRIRPSSLARAGALLAFLAGTAAHAQAAKPEVNSGDTAWVLAASALVMLMTPGLALFYGGMVRRKNALATLMQSFICLGLISVQWTLIGYSLAFAPSNPLLGGFQWLGLNGVGLEPHDFYGTTIPHQAFMIFQCMFAIITPALISGAFAERMKFSAFVLFILLWATLVYDPIAHWVWGKGGWLLDLGALDFAGGTVVHISSGISALICVLVMGKRRGYPSEEMRPHNLTMTLLGTGLLWFGWFGFNGGSSLAANGVGVNAFVVTNMAAAAAALAWMFIEWKHRGEPTLLGAASGAVAGLVGITPASGFVGVLSALAIGVAAGAFCYLAVVVLKPKLGYDDSLDTFGVHCVGGTVGALLTGVFASTAINSAGKNGLVFGNPGQVVTQLIGVAATMAYAAVVTFIILKVLDAIVGLRVKDQAEDEGLDISQHGELAYDL
jgi:Amt family ammonium transporter